MRKAIWFAGGAIAAGVVFTGGWAVAQSGFHGAGDMPRMMRHMDGGMGPGRMRQGGRQMSGGMMGMRGGMMGMHGGNATAREHDDIAALLFDHDKVKRTVTNLPNGIRTVTESDDPETAAVIKRHVAEMGKRIEQGRDPGLPIESPALRALFRDRDKIQSTYEPTEKGVIVIQTSSDATVVRNLQAHAAEVSDLAERGMAAAHEAMMRNGGMMGRGMMGRGGRGPFAESD